MQFIIRWIVTAVSVAAAVWLVPGIVTVGDNATIAVAVMALVFSLVNVSIKPILQFISMPISVLTLGIFYLVVNALLFEFAGWLAGSLFHSGIDVQSFGAAFMGSIVVSIVSAIVNGIIGNQS